MNGQRATILIVEDDPYVRENLREVLNQAGHATVEARDGKEALRLLTKRPVDLILLDLILPRVNGMEVLRQTALEHPEVPVVIISGEGTIPTAVEATKLGAYDFLEKPVTRERVLLTVRNALEKGLLQRQRDRLLEEANQRYRMIGTSLAMQNIYRLIDKAAATQSRVLIVGEHGSGKELVARAIHYNSSRAAGLFVAVNCAAIPESLIESELFGYEKGAFTHAYTARQGKFEQADGGTLFLDEVGDMSLMTQAKTLRVLSEGVVERLGGGQPIPVDVRVIAATNKDLESEMKEGNFREDLYYRLNVITIFMPPLRSHPEDIPDLVEHFLVYFCETMGRSPKELAPGVLKLLMEHDWRGNVRELRNLIERLVALSEGDTISLQEVAEALKKPVPPFSPDAQTGLREAREQFERDFILKTLIAHQWRIQDTAAVLGIERTHLWKKMKRYGVRRRQ